jgi:adenosylhomocysteine nucleosidase
MSGPAIENLSEISPSDRTARIAIVAALATETRTLVRSWPRQSVQSAGRTVSLAWSQQGVVAWAGMGPQNAIRALEAASALTSIEAVISIGFAGALTEDGLPGDLLQPSLIVDSRTGERFRTKSGDGSTMVTVERMADSEEKERLAETYGAQCCDMEAAGLARICLAQGLPFYAIKAISDDIDFSLPALEKFTTPQGDFRTGAFALYAIVHPGLWHSLVRLEQGASAAREALASGVREWVTSHPV